MVLQSFVFVFILCPDGYKIIMKRNLAKQSNRPLSKILQIPINWPPTPAGFPGNVCQRLMHSGQNNNCQANVSSWTLVFLNLLAVCAKDIVLGFIVLSFFLPCHVFGFGKISFFKAFLNTFILAAVRFGNDSEV